MISSEMIAAALNQSVGTLTKESEVRAPGMHHLHYAPLTKTSLIASRDIPAVLQNLNEAELPVVFVVHSDAHVFEKTQHIKWVKMSADAHSYAHELYRTLRSLDSQRFKRIIIEAVPESIEWKHS